MLSTKKYLVRMQVVIWIVSFLLFYLKYKALPIYTKAYILAITINSFLAFALVVYGYMFLYNRWFQKVKLATFIGMVIGLLVSVVLLKIFLDNAVVSRFTEVHMRLFYSDPKDAFITKVHLANSLGSCFFVLLLAILFKSFTESLALRERQAEIQKKHLETELNQLKGQVQPHFVFNSLNNLYYDTYKVLPNVAERMAMLSDIMRYFMEESPKERVPLSTEIEFIEDVIRLEEVRFSYPVHIELKKEADQNLMIPPMLLSPMVENVFKHGIKNDGDAMSIEIVVKQDKNKLLFRTKNKLYLKTDEQSREGMGLSNLRERLNLLYQKTYTLATRQQDGYFIAELLIPVYEN